MRRFYFEPRFAEAYVEHDLERANQIPDELGLAWDANREWRAHRPASGCSRASISLYSR